MNEIVKNNFKFDFENGVVNGLSKKTVKVTFRPTCRFDYDIKLVCSARENPISSLRATFKEKNLVSQKYSIKIRAKGDYPLLRFTDIRNDQLSVSTLWERFQLSSLNKELLTELNDHEIQY